MSFNINVTSHSILKKNFSRSISRAASSQTGSSVSPMPRRDTCHESRSRVTSVTCQSDSNSRVSPLPSDTAEMEEDSQLRFHDEDYYDDNDDDNDDYYSGSASV